MEILHPTEQEVQGEVTARQFEKYDFVFDHLTDVHDFKVRLFDHISEFHRHQGIEPQQVTFRFENKESSLGEGWVEHRYDEKPTGFYVNNSLVMLENSTNPDYPVCKAISNRIVYGWGRIQFHYSTLAIHQNGIIDFVSGLSMIKDCDFEDIHNGALGPYISRPGEMHESNEYFSHIAIKTNEHRYNTQLINLSDNKVKAPLSDREYLSGIRQSRKNLRLAKKKF